MVNEFQWETNQMEGGNYESFETLGEQGEVFGEQGEIYGEDEQEGVYESSYENQEVTGEGSFGEQEAEAVFNETQEMELAAELLSLSNEQELEQFLGNLMRSAGKAVGGFIRSPVGQALGGVLKGAARQALPIVGGALGGAIGGSGGADIGRTLATQAGQIFGLELEGLSGEDQEFEAARRYVRFAGAASGRAARAPGQASPRDVARSSVAAAARRHAPGLLRGGARMGQRGGMAGGRQGFAARRDGRRTGAYGRGRPGTPGGAAAGAGMLAAGGQQPGGHMGPRRPYFGGAVVGPGYGFPYPMPPTGGQGAPGGGDDDDQDAAGGLGGGQDPSGGFGDDQDPTSAGASPGAANGGAPPSGGVTTGPIPQSGTWTRQGRRLTIHL